MSQRFTLYWSSLDKFETCPQKFLWSKGWGLIDVGGGPGKKRPKPFKRSKHDAVMGIVIAEVMEDFYNLELWKHPLGLQERLEQITEKKFSLELARNYVDFKHPKCPSRTEMLAICTQGVLDFVRRTLKAHKLLGPFAQAEKDMVAFVNKWTPIGGRADLIFSREDTGFTIIDGKNSKEHWDRKTGQPIYYTDPDQLRWYALCFYLVYRKMPDRLGFVYFRYPHGYTWDQEAARYLKEAKEYGPSHSWKKKVAQFYQDREPASGVSWVEFTREDLKGLADRAVKARKAMDKEQFEARPEPKNCRFCDYETVCPQRQAQKNKNASKRRAKKADTLLDNATGVIEFQFGDGGGSVLVEKG